VAVGVSHESGPKRGYLANILTLPPLIYPFQYNPTRLTDAKSNKLRTRTDVGPKPEKGGGLGGLVSGAAAALSGDFSKALVDLGRTFSNAELHAFESEGDRTISFGFTIDGREQRPGEPDRRRNEDGHILGDLAVLRSFVYPQFGDLTEMIAGAFKKDADRFLKSWFNKPPTALLIMGDLSVEGFVTDLKINETMFNADLDPVRAEVEVTLVEKIDSLSFIMDSIKRIGRTFYHTAYEDIGDVIF
jgi:hypothetical protein